MDLCLKYFSSKDYEDFRFLLISFLPKYSSIKKKGLLNIIIETEEDGLINSISNTKTIVIKL
jgi:hypothetical protein